MDIKTSCKTGRLFIVSAPSGAGKTTLCRELLKRNPDIQMSVSCTTRKKRDGEIEGQDYHFTDKASFLQMIDKGEFAEWAEVHGEFYGTTIKALKNAESEGVDILLDIDWQGAKQIKEKLNKGIYIFILPPSIDELKKRLSSRGKDSEEVIERRLKNAAKEIEQSSWYDYNIINDDLEKAKKEFEAIILAEKCRTTLP